MEIEFKKTEELNSKLTENDRGKLVGAIMAMKDIQIALNDMALEIGEPDAETVYLPIDDLAINQAKIFMHEAFDMIQKAKEKLGEIALVKRTENGKEYYIPVESEDE